MQAPQPPAAEMVAVEFLFPLQGRLLLMLVVEGAVVGLILMVLAVLVEAETAVVVETLEPTTPEEVGAVRRRCRRAAILTAGAVVVL